MMTLNYIKTSEYARCITSYLVLANHKDVKTSIRLAELQGVVHKIRGHVNRDMLYRTLNVLEELQIITVTRRTLRGFKAGGKCRAASTMIFINIEAFRETLSAWAMVMGYESFSNFLWTNGYPDHIDVTKCCRAMKDGYTYIQQKHKHKALTAFTRT